MIRRRNVDGVLRLQNFSHAVSAGGFVFVSGALPTVGPTVEIAGGGVAGQTGQTITNLSLMLASFEATLDDLVRVTVYLARVEDFLEMDAAYGRLVTSRPARTAVYVARIPLGASVEMDAVAYGHAPSAPGT